MKIRRRSDEAGVAILWRCLWKERKKSLYFFITISISSSSLFLHFCLLVLVAIKPHAVWHWNIQLLLTIGGTPTKIFTCTATSGSGISFYIEDATYSYVKKPIIDAGTARISFNVNPRYKPRIIFPLDSFININAVS